MENKTYLQRLHGHLSTINSHKKEVMSLCFKCGLYKQGLLHDLSKYTLVEFIPGVKYFQGFRSPITAEREEKGYSLGWLHHEGRNKHHFEYWVDKNYNDMTFTVLPMPFNYMLEGVLDRIAASKIYNKEKYTDASAYEFFANGKDKIFMGTYNSRRIELLLKYLKDNGEQKALTYYKELYSKWKNNHSFDI